MDKRGDNNNEYNILASISDIPSNKLPPSYIYIKTIEEVFVFIEERAVLFSFSKQLDLLPKGSVSTYFYFSKNECSLISTRRVATLSTK